MAGLSAFPVLKSLQIQNTLIDDESLAHLVSLSSSFFSKEKHTHTHSQDHCRELEHLNLSGCVRLTTLAHMPCVGALRRVSVVSCQSLTAAGLAAVAAVAPNVEELQFSPTTQITDNCFPAMTSRTQTHTHTHTHTYTYTHTHNTQALLGCESWTWGARVC